MSYLRRVKRGIPKNTNRCAGCKNRVVKPIYKREKDTNGLYECGKYYFCKYLNIESSREDIYQFTRSINPSIYSEDEFNKMLDNTDKTNKLHYGIKACGLYPLRIRNNGHFEKEDFDDIPF